jgi:IMP dehydrogenase
VKIVSSTPEISYDDVLLLTNRCEYTTLDEERCTDITARISRKIVLSCPIMSSPMPGVSGAEMAVALSELGAIAVIHPFQGFGGQLEEVRTAKARGARISVGILDQTDLGFRHVKELVAAGADLISVESLQAHNTQTLDFIRRLKDSIPDVDVSVGVITTAEACEDLIDAGVDSIRVGIGGGSHCTTRHMTGVGRPYLSAALACQEVTRPRGIPLILDGGIRTPGDVVKALVFGADAVMIGGMFAGTDESPGVLIERDGRKYKQSWGMCTITASTHEQDYSGNLVDSNREKKKFEEGIQGLIPYRGSVRDLVVQLNAGVRRSMWYQGATSIADMREKATVVICSPGTAIETATRI